MVIAIFGDNCVGKSSIAENLNGQLSAEVFIGNDYFRLGKSESNAALQFKKQLQAAACGEGNIIYVISEKSQLKLLPEICLRVLVTASLSSIKERFARRMNGNLPAPVAAMLERKYGQFENEVYNIKIDTENLTSVEAVNIILSSVDLDGQ